MRVSWDSRVTNVAKPFAQFFEMRGIQMTSPGWLCEHASFAVFVYLSILGTSVFENCSFKNTCTSMSLTTTDIDLETVASLFWGSIVGTTDLKNRTGSSNLHSENEAGSSSRRPYWSDHLSSCANRPAYVKWQISKKFSFNFQRV